MNSPPATMAATTSPTSSTPAAYTMLVEFATPPRSYDDMVDVDHDDDVPTRFRAVDNLLGPGTPPGLATLVFDNPVFEAGELMFTSAEEPMSFKEAEKHDSWRRAMEEEMSSIEENKKWSLVDLPPEHKPI